MTPNDTGTSQTNQPTKATTTKIKAPKNKWYEPQSQWGDIFIWISLSLSDFVRVCVVYLHIMALYSQWAIYNIYDALKLVSLSQCERLFAVVYSPRETSIVFSLSLSLFCSVCFIFWFSIKNNFRFESIHTITWPAPSNRFVNKSNKNAYKMILRFMKIFTNYRLLNNTVCCTYDTRMHARILHAYIDEK